MEAQVLVCRKCFEIIRNVHEYLLCRKNSAQKFHVSSPSGLAFGTHKKDFCLYFDTNSKQTKLKLVLNFMQLQYCLCCLDFTAQMEPVATHVSLYRNHGYILFASALRICIQNRI